VIEQGGTHGVVEDVAWATVEEMRNVRCCGEMHDAQKKEKHAYGAKGTTGNSL
jgi:hypothetical protein